MIDDPVHITFQNSQNPSAKFDFIKLQELFSKKYKDHTPFQHHLVEFYIILIIEKDKETCQH